MQIDLLKMEWERKLPNWLSPRGRVMAKFGPRREALRQQWLQRQAVADSAPEKPSPESDEKPK